VVLPTIGWCKSQNVISSCWGWLEVEISNNAPRIFYVILPVGIRHGPRSYAWYRDYVVLWKSCCDVNDISYFTETIWWT
jgi:hypothetical protein